MKKTLVYIFVMLFFFISQIAAKPVSHCDMQATGQNFEKKENNSCHEVNAAKKTIANVPVSINKIYNTECEIKCDCKFSGPLSQKIFVSSTNKINKKDIKNKYLQFLFLDFKKSLIKNSVFIKNKILIKSSRQRLLYNSLCSFLI